MGVLATTTTLVPNDDISASSDVISTNNGNTDISNDGVETTTSNVQKVDTISMDNNNAPLTTSISHILEKLVDTTTEPATATTFSIPTNNEEVDAAAAAAMAVEREASFVVEQSQDTLNHAPSPTPPTLGAPIEEATTSTEATSEASPLSSSSMVETMVAFVDGQTNKIVDVTSSIVEEANTRVKKVASLLSSIPATTSFSIPLSSFSFSNDDVDDMMKQVKAALSGAMGTMIGNNGDQDINADDSSGDTTADIKPKRKRRSMVIKLGETTLSQGGEGASAKDQFAAFLESLTTMAATAANSLDFTPPLPVDLPLIPPSSSSSSATQTITHQATVEGAEITEPVPSTDSCQQTPFVPIARPLDPPPSSSPEEVLMVELEPTPSMPTTTTLASNCGDGACDDDETSPPTSYGIGYSSSSTATPSSIVSEAELDEPSDPKDDRWCQLTLAHSQALVGEGRYEDAFESLHQCWIHANQVSSSADVTTTTRCPISTLLLILSSLTRWGIRSPSTASIALEYGIQYVITKTQGIGIITPSTPVLQLEAMVSSWEWLYHVVNPSVLTPANASIHWSTWSSSSSSSSTALTRELLARASLILCETSCKLRWGYSLRDLFNLSDISDADGWVSNVTATDAIRPYADLSSKIIDPAQILPGLEERNTQRQRTKLAR
jgi:hypothetical protein